MCVDKRWKQEAEGKMGVVMGREEKGRMDIEWNGREGKRERERERERKKKRE